MSPFRYRSPSQNFRYLPVMGPLLFRAIPKRPAMTGSGLGRYKESRPAPGFRRGGARAFRYRKQRSLHMLQEFFLFDIRLLENREQCTRRNLQMVRNRDESPGFRMQKMNMAAGLAYRFETKNRKDLNYFKS